MTDRFNRYIVECKYEYEPSILISLADLIDT